MLLARLLAFLAMLLLAPVAQASPGDPAYGPGLLETEALVEASQRPFLAEADGEGADALPEPAALAASFVAPSVRHPLPQQRVACRWYTHAQSRAPPFPKA